MGGKHLQAYLDKFVFRFNRRRTPMAASQTLLGLGSQHTSPTYQALVDSNRLRNPVWRA